MADLEGGSKVFEGPNIALIILILTMSAVDTGQSQTSTKHKTKTITNITNDRRILADCPAMSFVFVC